MTIPSANPMTSALQKPRIAAALVEHADKRGWVDRTTGQMQAELGIPEHELVHAIWDFQKLGYLRFRERKATSGAVELTGLRITSVGRKGLATASENGHAEERVTAGTMTMTRPEEPTWRDESPAELPLAEAFPLTAALVLRRERLEQAAALLEAAGQDELALTTLERANDPKLLSPLEAEAVRMYRRAQESAAG